MKNLLPNVLYRGSLIGLHRLPFEDVAILAIDEDRKGKVLLPCHGTPTATALGNEYPGAFDGNRIDNKVIEGERIYFYVDGGGGFLAFTPAERVPPDMIAVYEKDGIQREGDEVKVVGIHDDTITTEPRRMKPSGGTGMVIDRGLLPPDDRIYRTGPIVSGRPLFPQRESSPKKKRVAD